MTSYATPVPPPPFLNSMRNLDIALPFKKSNHKHASQNTCKAKASRPMRIETEPFRHWTGAQRLHYVPRGGVPWTFAWHSQFIVQRHHHPSPFHRPPSTLWRWLMAFYSVIRFHILALHRLGFNTLVGIVILCSQCGAATSCNFASWGGEEMIDAKLFFFFLT